MLQKTPAPVKSGSGLAVLVFSMVCVLVAVAVMTAKGKGHDPKPLKPTPVMTVNPNPQPDHNSRSSPSARATLPNRGPRYTYLISVQLSLPRREPLHMTVSVGGSMYQQDLSEQVNRNPVILERYEYLMVLIIQLEPGLLGCKIERLNADGSTYTVDSQHLENRTGAIQCEAYGGD